MLVLYLLYYGEALAKSLILRLVIRLFYECCWIV